MMDTSTLNSKQNEPTFVVVFIQATFHGNLLKSDVGNSKGNLQTRKVVDKQRRITNLCHLPMKSQTSCPLPKIVEGQTKS